MLERMRENPDETGVVLGLRGAVRFVLLASEERRLRRSRPTFRLHPAPAAVRRNERTCIQAHQTLAQSAVGHFQGDAANVLVAEEILANEFKVVKSARVEEKRIAAPAREEAIAPGLRHLRLAT